MKYFFLFSALSLLPLTSMARQHDDAAAIRMILVDSYVEGLHVYNNEAAVRRGFHPGFVMHVFDEGQIIQVSLEMWLEHLQLDGTQNPSPVEHRFDRIDVTGNTAVVKLQVYEDAEHLYTDYFGLYRFEEGWRIVNKVFQEH